MQLVIGPTSIAEVVVVQQRVLDICFGKLRGERLLPDTFRHPHATDIGAKAILKPLGVSLDLANTIPRWDHRQDRFEVGSTDDLNPASLDQTGKPIEVLRVRFGQPLHQRATGVQSDL